jgi:hypothetical protein
MDNISIKTIDYNQILKLTNSFNALTTQKTAFRFHETIRVEANEHHQEYPTGNPTV